jgi:hypothetical protein
MQALTINNTHADLSCKQADSTDTNASYLFPPTLRMFTDMRHLSYTGTYKRYSLQFNVRVLAFIISVAEKVRLSDP